MRDACIRAVSNAMGRTPNQAQLRNIEARIMRQMRQLAQTTPEEWASLPHEEQLKRAGESAARELMDEADRALRREQDNIVALARQRDFVNRQVAGGEDATRLRALSRLLNAEPEGRNLGDTEPLEAKLNGRYSIAVSQLIDLLEAGKQEGIWRVLPWGDPKFQHVQRLALAGETKGVPPFLVQAVEAYRLIAEQTRAMLNAKGFEIGRLEGFDSPHMWSDRLVMDAIARDGREAVVKRFADGRVRERYFHENGRPFSDKEALEFMDAALDSIIYDGLQKKRHPDMPPTANGSVANRHRHHRVIHLRRDVLPDMLRDFSEVGPMESLLSSLHAQFRDLAAVDVFGPNARTNFLHLIDEALADDIQGARDKNEIDRVKKYADELRIRFDVFSGNYLDVESQKIANAFGLARGVVAGLALPMTVLTTVSDLAPLYATTIRNGMNPAQLFIEDVRAFAGGGRRWARRAGLLTDTVTGYADRFTHDFVTGRDMGTKVASFTVRTSLMNWVTEARRQAWMTHAMDTIGHMTRHYDSVAALKEDDRRIAALLSITEDTWSVWRAARKTTAGASHTLLDPQAIMALPDDALAPIIESRRAAIEAELANEVANVQRAANMLGPEQLARTIAQRNRLAQDRMAAINPDAIRFDAAASLIGILKNEMDSAVITPGLKERANLVGRSRPGTWWGEFRRSMVLFKSFPWTYLNRHWHHSMKVTPNRIGYGFGLIMGMWSLGIVANWLYDLAYGRDPRTINVLSSDQETREAARGNLMLGFFRGGGAGILGDLVNPDNYAGQPNQLSSSLTGPVVGKIDQIGRATLGNLQQEALGQESNIGSELVGLAERNTPVPWYFKTIVSRNLFARIAEDLEPGYASKMQNRMERTYGTRYWWNMDERAPHRAPDLLAPFRDSPEN
jgi:hypothetical protein